MCGWLLISSRLPLPPVQELLSCRSGNLPDSSTLRTSIPKIRRTIGTVCACVRLTGLLNLTFSFFLFLLLVCCEWYVRSTSFLRSFVPSSSSGSYGYYVCICSMVVIQLGEDDRQTDRLWPWLSLYICTNIVCVV